MEPKIVIVDNQDNIIGYKERETLGPKDIYRVSALWITNSKREVLLARRSLSKSHDPGKWGPAVAGTVDEGEDNDSNIVKEMEEELGLKGIKPTKGPKERVFGKYNYFIQWYLLVLDKPISEFKIKEGEVEEIRWFSIGKLRKRISDRSDEFLDAMSLWVDLFINNPSLRSG